MEQVDAQIERAHAAMIAKIKGGQRAEHPLNDKVVRMAEGCESQPIHTMGPSYYGPALLKVVAVHGERAVVVGVHGGAVAQVSELVEVAS